MKWGPGKSFSTMKFMIGRLDVSIKRPSKISYSGTSGQRRIVSFHTEQVPLFTALVGSPGWDIEENIHAHLFAKTWPGASTIEEGPNGVGRVTVSYSFEIMDIGYGNQNIQIMPRR